MHFGLDEQLNLTAPTKLMKTIGKIPRTACWNTGIITESKKRTKFLHIFLIILFLFSSIHKNINGSCMHVMLSYICIYISFFFFFFFVSLVYNFYCVFSLFNVLYLIHHILLFRLSSKLMKKTLVIKLMKCFISKGTHKKYCLIRNKKMKKSNKIGGILRQRKKTKFCARACSIYRTCWCRKGGDK